MEAFFTMKLRVFSDVLLLVILPYILLQNFPVFPGYTMPISDFDNLIPFNDQSIWGYQSLYLYILIRAFSMADPEELIRYASMFTLSAGLSFLVFFFFPTLSPRPEVENANWMYSEFVKWEKPLNAFPSMHVSLVLTTCIFTLNDLRCHKLFKLLGVLWTLWIIFSTLQSKQHVAIDVLGGILVTAIAYYLNKTVKPLNYLEKRWGRLKPVNQE